MSNQPVWKYTGLNYGDASPLDYGGLFLYVDESGVYSPQLEKLEEPCEHAPEGSSLRHQYTVYRLDVDRCTFENGVLSDNEYHKDSPVWWATGDKLQRLASFASTTVSEIVEGACSADPRQRAWVYELLLSYYGPHEFDSYPLYLSREEARERYKESNGEDYGP